MVCDVRKDLSTIPMVFNETKEKQTGLRVF